MATFTADQRQQWFSTYRIETFVRRRQTRSHDTLPNCSPNWKAPRPPTANVDTVPSTAPSRMHAGRLPVTPTAEPSLPLWLLSDYFCRWLLGNFTCDDLQEPQHRFAGISQLLHQTSQINTNITFICCWQAIPAVCQHKDTGASTDKNCHRYQRVCCFRCCHMEQLTPGTSNTVMLSTNFCTD